MSLANPLVECAERGLCKTDTPCKGCVHATPDVVKLTHVIPEGFEYIGTVVTDTGAFRHVYVYTDPNVLMLIGGVGTTYDTKYQRGYLESAGAKGHIKKGSLLDLAQQLVGWNVEIASEVVEQTDDLDTTL